MKRETIRLWLPEEYHYPAAWGFLPRLDAYLHDDDTVRPAIIVTPGGGYRRCSPREGECIALRFYELGYQTFVCTYTNNTLEVNPLELQPAKDIARAVCYVRKNADALRVQPASIALCGFSAGAHAAATVGVHWKDLADPGEPVSSSRPDALLLCYPVISLFSDIAHKGSGINLLGEEPSAEKIHYMQLDKHVRPDCPPAFLWHTLTDRTVDPENSRIFAAACQAAGVPVELHLFPSGDHGLSLADGSVVVNDENLYTLEQTACVLEAVEQGKLKLTPEMEQHCLSYPEVMILRTHGQSASPATRNEEARRWVDLAHQWLLRIADKQNAVL